MAKTFDISVKRGCTPWRRACQRLRPVGWLILAHSCGFCRSESGGVRTSDWVGKPEVTGSIPVRSTRETAARRRFPFSGERTSSSLWPQFGRSRSESRQFCKRLARESERRQTARVSEPERPPSGGRGSAHADVWPRRRGGSQHEHRASLVTPHPLPPPIVHTRCCSVRYALTLGIAQCA